MTADRCPTCDRPSATAELAAHKGGCVCASCLAHCWREWGVMCDPAPWRARAIAAEADAARLRAHIDAAGDGTNLPALLDLYHNRAEQAEAAATRWRKVAPLIERLADDVRRRELIARAEFDRRVIDTVTNLLAATQEPTL